MLRSICQNGFGRNFAFDKLADQTSKNNLWSVLILTKSYVTFSKHMRKGVFHTNTFIPQVSVLIKHSPIWTGIVGKLLNSAKHEA